MSSSRPGYYPRGHSVRKRLQNSEMKSEQEAGRKKWDEVLGKLVFGDSTHLMSNSVLSQLPSSSSDYYSLERFMLSRQHSDVLYSPAIQLFPDSDVYLAHKNSILSAEAATCSGSVLSTTLPSSHSKPLTHVNTLVTTPSPAPSSLSLVPGLLGGVASACSFYYAAKLSNFPRGEAAVDGAAAGLISSTTRYMVASLCLQTPWLPKSVGYGCGDILALGVFALAHRSRYHKLQTQGLISQAEREANVRRALFGSVGGLVGAKVAVALFGDSGAANLVGGFAGTYFSNRVAG